MALLESLKPKAVHDAGCWRLPDGEAYYATALVGQTTTKITPDEVHKLGRDVTAELSARADVLFKQLGFTKGTVGERYIALYETQEGRLSEHRRRQGPDHHRPEQGGGPIRSACRNRVIVVCNEGYS